MAWVSNPAVPAFSDCWKAARLVRRAEHGHEALKVIRPRGYTGLVRSRGPLSVLLYRAAREGRLLWWSPSNFVLLEPPGRYDGPWWLRWLDRGWDTLIFAFPPGLLVALGGLVGLMFRFTMEGTLVALSLLLLAMAYLVVMMTALAIYGLHWIYRRLVVLAPRELSDEGVQQLRGNHCVIPLCHLTDVVLARSLPDEARTRVSHWSPKGVPDRQIRGFVCMEHGVTTTRTREELAAVPGVHRLMSALPYLVFTLDGATELAEPDTTPVQATRAIPVLLLTLSVLILTGTQQVAKSEREACEGEECQARPTTYLDAVYWLLNRLSGGDPEGLGAATLEGRSIGVLVTLTSVIIVGWVITSLLQQSVAHTRNAGRELVQSFNESVRTPPVDTVTQESAEPVRRHMSTPTATAAGTHLLVVFTIGLAAGLVASRFLRRSRIRRQ